MASKTFKAVMLIGGKLDGSFTSMLGKTQTGLKGIGKTIGDIERKQVLLGKSIQTFGKMGKNVDGLRERYVKLGKTLDDLKHKQNWQGKIGSNASARSATGAKLGRAGAATATLGAALLFPTRQAIEFETAMLGVAKQVQGARDANGNLTSVYFEMKAQIQQLGHELPIATNEIAGMVEAAARMNVPKERLIEFVRTAAMMGTAFDAPVDELTDQMGKVANVFNIPIQKIGEFADVINYLDDQSISKGADIIDVMQRIGGIASTVGMARNEAAALGSTFLSLGSSSEVAATASNAVMRILGTASAQSKRVRSGLSDIGFNPLKIQAEMAKRPTETILKLLDKLNTLSNEDRLVAATRIFGAEYGDDIAKLAVGTAEYRRQLALANSEQAKGSMSREFSARMKSTAAQWETSKNQIREIGVAIGDALLPAVNSLMKDVTPLVGQFANWSKENPGLIKGVIGAALGMSALNVGALGAKFAFQTTLGPLLKFRKWLTPDRMETFGKVAGRIGSVIKGLGPRLLSVGGSILRIGRMATIAGRLMLLSPLGIAIGLLAGAAFLIWKNWEPIKGFFIKLWDDISIHIEAFKLIATDVANAVGNAFQGAWDYIKTGASAMVDWVTVKLGWIGEQARKVGKTFMNFVGAGQGTAGGQLSSPKAAAAVRNASAAVASNSTSNRTVNATVNVVQQPGQDSRALAREVAKEIKRQEGVANRSRMTDAVA